MRNPRETSRAELVTAARSAINAVANGKVSGFLPEQNALIAQTGTEAADKSHDANEDNAGKKLAYHESTSRAVQAHKVLVEWFVSLKAMMRGANATVAQYEAVGLEPPRERRRLVDPDRPSDLIATAPSAGVIDLKFKRNNPPGSVTFLIECRSDRDLPFGIIGTTTSQKFRHFDTVRGQFYEYRVRAQAGRNRKSDASNLAVIHGI
jgi:hypothetical protein